MEFSKCDAHVHSGICQYFHQVSQKAVGFTVGWFVIGCPIEKKRLPTDAVAAAGNHWRVKRIGKHPRGEKSEEELGDDLPLPDSS